jgi:hypothetical protein
MLRLGKLIGLVVGFGISLIFAWFIFPDAGVRYDGWFGAVWYGTIHGGLFVPNWILGLIYEGHGFKADNASVAYAIWWWIAAVSAILRYLSSVLKVISNEE